MAADFRGFWAKFRRRRDATASQRSPGAHDADDHPDAVRPSADRPDDRDNGPRGEPGGEKERIDTVSSTTGSAPSAPKKKRKPSADAVLTAAVDIARAAVLDVADPAEVGEHIGAAMEDDRLVTHSFACTAKGYRGWHWVAVLTRIPRSKRVTVCETALLPGDDALTAPAWLPWEERLEPGDMGPLDVLPYTDDDPNLEPGYEETNDDDSDRLAIYELGLGRPRVLSPEGRRNAAERWESGANGPASENARNSDKSCASCGYLMLLAGSLRGQFGVCANAWSPQDGQVVSLDHGCGAHSETDARTSKPAAASTLVDEIAVDGLTTR